MPQVIDAGPEIGTVEFPDEMSDDEISAALGGELERLQTMPSVRPELTAPGESELGPYANGRPPSEAEQSAAVANPDFGRMDERTRNAPTRLNAEQEERSARESILQRQYDQAGMIDDPTERKAKQGEILGAMRQNGFDVVKPEAGVMEAASSPLLNIPKLARPLGDLERLGVKEPVASQVARGVVNAASGIAQFFTTPLGIATLGIGSLPAEAQQLISGAFAVDMARHAPEMFAELGKAVANQEWDKATELALSAGATIYFAGKSGEHALYGPDGMPNPARVAGLIGDRVMEEVKSGRIAAEHPNDVAVMLADPRGADWFLQRDVGSEMPSPALRAEEATAESVPPAAAAVAAVPEARAEEETAPPEEIMPEQPKARRGRKAKAETPVEVEEKVQDHVDETAAAEGKRPAKEVKSELVARLEEAIAKAPSDDDFVDEKPPKITVDIPGDGTFTIFNTKEALGEVLARAKRLETNAGKSKPDVKMRSGKEQVFSREKAESDVASFERQVAGLGDEDRIVMNENPLKVSPLPKNLPAGGGKTVARAREMLQARLRQITKLQEPGEVLPGKGKSGEAVAPANIEPSTLPRRIEGETAGPAAGEPVGLADIRQYLEKALDIPIRLGVGSRRVLGFFRQNPETIRMKALNDITTIAHEVGHYLHFLLFPESGPVRGPRALLAGHAGASDFAKGFDAELLPLGKRTSRGSYTQQQVRMEGVAEFLSDWMKDRTQAFAHAPGFAKFFEETLQREHPNVWTIVERARQDLKRYINQPAELKVDSRIDRKGDRERRSALEFFREQVDDWVNELAPIARSLQRLVDFGLPPKQAQIVNDLAVNYIGGWRGKTEYALYHRQIDLAGNDVGPSLREILSGIEDTRELGNYLVAKRELELAGRGIQTGLRPEEIREQRAWVAKMDAKYGRKAGQLYEFQRNQLALLRDSGLISAQSYSRMVAQNEFYVPFQRIMEQLGGAAGAKKGEGFINLSAGVYKLKGSDRKYVDPLESVLKNAYLFRDLAERNKVARAFVDAVEMVRGGGRVAESIARKVKPVTFSGEEIEGQLRRELAARGIELEQSANGPLLENVALTIWRAAKQASPKEGTFTVWEDGKERVYQVDDEHLYRALSLADSNDASFFARIPFMKTMRAFTRWKRAGATLTFEFMARNPFRDQVTAGVFSKHGFVPFWDGFRGMLSALGKDQYYWDWVKSGGRYADFIATDRKDLQSHLRDVIKDRGALQFALELANPLNVVKNLQKFSEVMEQATRIAEFRNAKRAGATDLEAANASKDVTLNFSRAGFKGKLVNQLVAFFNAGIQDIDKFARAHQERPVQTALKGMLYISLPSVVAWWLGHDDETMQKLPEWRKIGFWNVNAGKLAGKEDLVLSFPKPFLLGQIYGTSMEKGLDLAFEKDPNAVRKWFMATLQATPLTLNNLLPSVATPLIENWANRSFFKDAPLENASMQDLPAGLRFGPQTSLIARKLGGLTPIDGGYSPIKIDNLVRGYFAGLGKYGLDIADWMTTKINGQNLPSEPAKSIWERPLVRAFARSPYESSAYVERFYDGIERAEQRMNGFKALGQSDTPAAKKFFEGNRNSILWYAAEVQGKSMLTRLREARQNLGEILKAMREVQGSRAIAPEEKRRRLIELGNVRDGIAEAAYKIYLSPEDRKRIY